MWIISKIPTLRLASFFIFLANFPLMQSIHCSNYEDFNDGRIDALTKRSILPLEIWPKRQCHNFDEIALIRLRFLVTFSCEEAFLFSGSDSKYNLSCR